MSDTTDTGYLDDEPAQPRQHRIRYDPMQTRGESAFREAARHSRLVRWLKFILPALAILGAGVFWATARIIPSNFEDIVSVAGIDVESNSVVMDAPHISGFEGTRRAYDVKAASAVQSLSDPKVITFNEIDASIGLDQAGTAEIDAVIGVYDGNDNTLDLTEGISIRTTDGYAATFASAAIDLDAGSLASDEPLEISSKDGSLRANGVRVEDRGKKVSFINGVSVKFLPPANLMVAPGTPSGGTQ